MGLTPDPTSIDPRVAYATSMFGPVQQMMFQTLVFHDLRGQITPLLAERWELVDPTHLKLYLRKGVKFQNGEPFNAEAVKFTLESFLDNNLKFTQKAFQQFLPAIGSVQVVDDSTAVLVLKHPSRSALSNLEIIGMVPPVQAAADGASFGTKHPAGTGPYRFAEYVPGVRWVLERNPSYWGTPARTDHVTIRFIPDDAARVASLESGEVSIIDNVPPDSVARLRASTNEKIVSSNTTRIVYIETRCDRAPFNVAKARTAVNYAVDRARIVGDLFQGHAQVAHSVYSPLIPGYNGSLPQYVYDPSTAKRLLSEAGYPNGVKIKFGYPTGRYLNDKALGEVLTAQLSGAGFDVDAETGEWGTYLGNALGGKYDAYILAIGTITLDPGYATTQFGTGAAFSKFSDPEIDALLLQGDQTFDPGKVAAIYQKIQALVWARGPWAPLYFQPELDATSAKVSGYAARPDEYVIFSSVVVNK